MTAREGERAAEWAVDYPGDLEFRDDGEARVSEVELPVGKKRILDFVVHVPHGVRYGDKLAVVLNCVSRGDPLVSDSLTLAVAARQDYFLVKTALGQERDVVDAIGNRAIRSNVAVFAVLAPAKLRGYVFVEAMNKDRLKDVVRGIRKARGVVDRGDVSLTFEEILPYLTPKPLVSGIKEGDIVELVSGPFKGEKARVMSIDESREEITVELFEAMVPIPVTIRGDSVRVLEKSRG
ncbi:MAG: transcription elongation factor Spt5 [Thermoplasmata archaeon]|nr:transcription elongation factor Spt5 [Thermoplasmata archaeon]